MNRNRANTARQACVEVGLVVVPDVDHVEELAAKTGQAVQRAAALKSRLAIGVALDPGTIIV